LRRRWRGRDFSLCSKGARLKKNCKLIKKDVKMEENTIRGLNWKKKIK